VRARLAVPEALGRQVPVLAPVPLERAQELATSSVDQIDGELPTRQHRIQDPARDRP
jgi:hypothetical protein